MPSLNHTEVSVDKQLEAMRDEISNHLWGFENDLNQLVLHLKGDAPGVVPHMLIREMRDHIGYVVEKAAIATLINLLSHPDRFAAITSLAANVKQREKP